VPRDRASQGETESEAVPAGLRSPAEAASLRLKLVLAPAELAVVTHERGCPRLQAADRPVGRPVQHAPSSRREEPLCGVLAVAAPPDRSFCHRRADSVALPICPPSRRAAPVSPGCGLGSYGLRSRVPGSARQVRENGQGTGPAWVASALVALGDGMLPSRDLPGLVIGWPGSQRQAGR
jgi:hypothetical protein